MNSRPPPLLTDRLVASPKLQWSSRSAALCLLGLALVPLLAVTGMLWYLQYRHLMNVAEQEVAQMARPTKDQVYLSDGSRTLHTAYGGVAPSNAVVLNADYVRVRGDVALVSASPVLLDDGVRPQVRHLGWVFGTALVLLLIYALAVWQLGRRWLVNPVERLAGTVRDIELGIHEGRIAPLPGRVREVVLLQRGLASLWTGLSRHAHERDEALHATMNAQREMQELLNQMGDGFLILDRNWRVKFCNRRAAELVLKAPDELTGEGFWGVFIDDARRQIQATCEREIAHGRSFSTEDYHPHFGRWFERKFFTSNEGIGVIVRDTTAHWELIDELRARERRYRDLFEVNPNVMWIFDTDTLELLAVNAAAVKRYGYTEAEFLTLRASDIGPAEDRELFLDALRSVSGRESLGDDARIWRHLTKSGELMLVDVVYHAIKFKDRSARLVMATDVTTRMTAESKLRGEFVKLVRRYDEATSSLLATRQIVNGQVAALVEDVLPTLQLVQSLPDHGDAAMLHAREESTRVSEVLHEVLNLSQIGRMPFTATTVDVSALALEVLQGLARKHPQRVIHLDIEPGMVCRADAAAVRLLVQALLDNAWKFTARQGSAWIRMGALQREGDKPRGFFVSDNGIGFDVMEASRLYVPLARLNSASGYAGHGFGLATAHAVVARHGGEIWVQATPDRGATFNFTLESCARVTSALVAEVVIDSVPPWDD